MLTFVSAYWCYCIAELTNASGMLSVFLCGLVLSHYHRSNITPAARIVTDQLSEFCSLIAEAAVYIFLGMTLTRSLRSSEQLTYDVRLIAVVLSLCFVGRAVAVVLIGYLLNVFTDGDQKLTKTGLVTVWFSGVRGAIPFALAIQMPSRNRNLVTTTTLAIVIITTIINSVFTSPLLHFLQWLKPQSKEKIEKLEGWNTWEEIDRLLSKTFGGERHAREQRTIMAEKTPQRSHYHSSKIVSQGGSSGNVQPIGAPANSRYHLSQGAHHRVKGEQEIGVREHRAGAPKTVREREGMGAQRMVQEEAQKEVAEDVEGKAHRQVFEEVEEAEAFPPMPPTPQLVHNLSNDRSEMESSLRQGAVKV